MLSLRFSTGAAKSARGCSAPPSTPLATALKTSSSAWSGSSRERDLLIMPKIIVIIDRALSYAYTLIGNYVLLTSVKTGFQCCLKIDVRYRVHS